MMSESSADVKQPLDIETVAKILAKPAKERTRKDYERVHSFMIENIMFFKPKKLGERVGREPRLTLREKTKMYEVMQYKLFEKGANLCNFGEKGDSFFIILEGTVGIRVPMMIERGINSTWDIYKYIIKKFKIIRQYKDEHTELCHAIINIIGRKILKQHNF